MNLLSWDDDYSPATRDAGERRSAARRVEFPSPDEQRLEEWGPQDERGTATVALFLATLILGGLALLALSVLRPAMCDWHDEALSYCPGFVAEQQR